jgi:GAF domain-containing protein
MQAMNLNSQKTNNSDSRESAVLTYEQWKRDFLRVVLRVSAILFLIAVIFGFSSNALSANILYISLAAILAIAGFTPLPYSIRSFILVVIFFVAATNLMLIWGIQGDASMVYLGAIVLTALLYEKGQEFITLFLTILMNIVVAARTLNGQHILSGWSAKNNEEFYALVAATWVDWIVYAVDLLAVGLLLIFAIRLLKTRFHIILQEAKSSLSELAAAGSQLEAGVQERTAELNVANKQVSDRVAQLKAITELSESIAQLKDLNEIFPATTKLISERFGFYHVGIFLVDRDREYAILQAANSKGGERMLARNHRLKLGVGVVGFCAQTSQPRIALDVGADSVYFNNPDLPETRSEVALPLKSLGETVGVLDVQSTVPSAFSSEDLQVLTALANQVSIALENARLLTEARAAYTQVQEVYNEFTKTEWSRTISQTQQPGFRYQTGRIEMLENALPHPEVASAVQSGEIVASGANGSRGKSAAVAVPVKLRGEVIGILHIESGDPSRAWQEDEVSLVQAVAERAAFAMENARLFQDARRRAAKERLISEATARISGAFNVENILRTTAQELERVLGGSEISIQFQSKEKS